MAHRSQLYFLFGLWVSFVGFLMAGIALLPQRPIDAVRQSATVYQSVTDEELHASSNISHIGKVILADLGSNTVSLYDNNQKLKTFPMVSFPAPYTIWEAASGKYAVEKKEFRHFSTFAHVWVPYVIQVHGNIFIHGDPETPFEKNEGSIHLSNSDAKEAFDFSDVDTQVAVIGAASHSAFPSESAYYLDGGGTLPRVAAPSFVVADIDSGEVLWERDANRLMNPGSLISLSTALTAVEHVDQYKTIRIGEVVLPPSVQSRHVPSRDDEVELGSLIYPLMFATNDTAGKTYQNIVGTSQFVSLMNERAREIGMEHSEYSSGLLGNDATTTTHDLFTLLAYIDRAQHFLIDVSLRTESSVFASSGKERLHWDNKNPWVIAGDGRYRGGLSQEDISGKGSAALIFSLPVSEFNKRNVAFIVLGSPDLRHDVALLQSFIDAHYRYGVKRTDSEHHENLTLPQSFLRSFYNLADAKHLLETDFSYDRRL